MKILKLVLFASGILVSLCSCKRTSKPEIVQNVPAHNSYYVSLDGSWRVTPETSIKYPHGTLEPVFHLSKAIPGPLSFQGCFLWERRFYDYWDIDSIRYVDSINLLALYYDNGGVFKGVVNEKNDLIQGIAYWDAEDLTDTASLEFYRDEDLDLTRFFIPYQQGPDGSIQYMYKQPDDCEDQLECASLFEYINDTDALYKLMGRIIKQEFGRLESLLILKDQKLVLEEYFYGYNRDTSHFIHSCTKSVTSLLLGISLGRHNMLDTDQSIFSFFPQLDSLKTPEKEKITLKHVLTMNSGLFDEDTFPIDDPGELAAKTLALPIVAVAGDNFTYSGTSANLMASIIYTLEGKQADEFADEVFFNKLGISEYIWPRENGVLYCPSGLKMKPRDMAKIGLLTLNSGSWKGEQIVPEAWIKESTLPHVAESEFFDYGYQWWYRSKQNTSWWDDPLHGSKDEHDMFLALGYGGQYIMVIRDLNMVIVVTSSDYNEENGMAHQKVPMVIEELVPLFIRE